MLPAATPSLDLPSWVWWLTIGIAVAVLVFDVIWIARNPHRPSNKETGIALGVYVGAAIAFGLGMWVFAGGQLAGEFFAGLIFAHQDVPTRVCIDDLALIATACDAVEYLNRVEYLPL